MSKHVLTGGSVLATVALIVGAAIVAPTAAAQAVDPEVGMVIVSVAPDGPAAAAGVVRGDILQAFDGQALQDLSDLRDLLAEREPGDEVTLTVLHGDDLRTLEATLGDQAGNAYLGLTPCYPAGGLRATTRIAAQPGALITEVVADSPAEEAGLREGDLIVSVDGEKVAGAIDLADLLAGHEPGDTVTLEFEREGEDLAEIEVQLGEHAEKDGAPYLGVLYRPTRFREVWEGRLGPFGEMQGLDDLDLKDFDLEGMPFHHGEEFDFEEMPFWHFDDLDLDKMDMGEVRQGSVLRQVTEDSPASAAGLQEGDVITAVDGEPLDGPQALAEAIAQREPGDEITLTLYSGDADEKRQVPVTLGEHPDEEGQAYLGVTVGGFFMQRYRSFPEVEGTMPFRWPSDADGTAEKPGDWSPFGFRFRLPFNLHDLPFDLDELPFDLDELPGMLPFRELPTEESGGATFGESA